MARAQKNPPPVERLAYRMNEVVKATGISRAQLYELMSEGRLRYSQVGGIRLIPASELNKLLAVDDDTPHQAAS